MRPFGRITVALSGIIILCLLSGSLIFWWPHEQYRENSPERGTVVRQATGYAHVLISGTVKDASTTWGIINTGVSLTGKYEGEERLVASARTSPNGEFEFTANFPADWVTEDPDTARSETKVWIFFRDFTLRFEKERFAPVEIPLLAFCEERWLEHEDTSEGPVYRIDAGVIQISRTSYF